MRKKLLESINKRLEVIIALLLHLSLQSTKKPSLKEQIKALNHLGVEPKTMASVLGRTRNFINKELFRLRKSGEIKK